MFYVLYEIRNNLNGKIYVGVHKTRDINDGYMGSGKVICAAIAKYGIENFTKRILEQFETSAAMFAREKEFVTDEFLLREDVYNLRRGGTGGFDYINKEGKNHKFSKDECARGAMSQLNSMTEDERSKKARYSRSFNKTTDSWAAAREAARSTEALQKRKETYARIGHQQGEKHSQFGTMWVTNEIESKKIKKTDPVPEGWRKGRVIVLSVGNSLNPAKVL